MELPPNWTENRIELSGVSLRYHRTGGNKPPLVLLHGAMDNGLCWTRIAKMFEADFDIIMPDARGHGQSFSRIEDYTLEDMVDDIAQLIHELSLEKPVLMGHSMGGQMATLLAAKHPDLPRKILLEDPAYSFNKGGGLTLFFMRLLFGFMIRRNRKRSLAQIKKMGDKLNKKWHVEEKDPWVVAQKEFAENAGTSLFKRFSVDIDWHALFPKITAPALLIIPEKGMLKIGKAQEIIGEFRDGQIAYIEKAGHNVRRENYSAFIEAVSTFLKQ